MTRFLPILMVVALAAAVRAEDQAPPAVPTVTEVARALGSTEPKERERGERLLVQALRAAPDRAALLEALARALRAVNEPPVAPAEPTSKPAAPAPPLAPALPSLAPPAPAPSPPPQQEAEGQTVAPRAAKEPTWTLRAWGVSVPEREAGPLRKALDDLGATGAKKDDVTGYRLVHGPVERVPEWVGAAQRAADAEPLGEATLALADDEARSAHLGHDVIYRCCVEPVKDGSWSVSTGTIETGLSLSATVTKDGLRLEPTWVAVAQPIPTVKTRPAPGVDAIELDRPDWSTARTRHDLARGPEGGAALLVVPGLLPDAGRVLVLVLELKRR